MWKNICREVEAKVVEKVKERCKGEIKELWDMRKL